MNLYDFQWFRRNNATMGIFLTEYCPVQCGHCAVSASLNSSPPNENLIYHVQEMAALPNLQAVAITGGEPFAFPDQLHNIVNILKKAGKGVVVHTSCYWGDKASSSKIKNILSAVDGIIVGIDRYHGQRIAADVLCAALVAATQEKCWIAAQVIDTQDKKDKKYAVSLLRRAFGSDSIWQNHVELLRIPPLSTGRAKKKFGLEKQQETNKICFHVKGPTLLLDGSLAACCNPDIVRGYGPDCLRTATGEGINSALDFFSEQPLIKLLATWPPVLLNELVSLIHDPSCPAIKHSSPCAACWQAAETIKMMDNAAIQLCQSIPCKAS